MSLCTGIEVKLRGPLLVAPMMVEAESPRAHRVPSRALNHRKGKLKSDSRLLCWIPSALQPDYGVGKTDWGGGK